MKTIIISILAFTFPVLTTIAQSDTLRFDPSGEDPDSVEYELIVMDPGYESFLVTQPSMEYYSKEYYENWNIRYVQEWNIRHAQPMVYGDNYQTYIDYRRDVDYGLELNYRLYHYFRFFEKENGVDLLPGKSF